MYEDTRLEDVPTSSAIDSSVSEFNAPETHVSRRCRPLGVRILADFVQFWFHCTAQCTDGDILLKRLQLQIEGTITEAGESNDTHLLPEADQVASNVVL